MRSTVSFTRSRCSPPRPQMSHSSSMATLSRSSHLHVTYCRQGSQWDCKARPRRSPRLASIVSLSPRRHAATVYRIKMKPTPIVAGAVAAIGMVAPPPPLPQSETTPDCGGVCGGYWYGAACHASPQVSDQPNVSRECACCNYNGDWTTCGYFSMWPNVTCELSGAGDGSTLYTYVWPPPDPNPCIESCKDECLPGTALCVAAMDGYGRPCGNYDADPCLEWGAGQPNLNVCDCGCKADVDCGET